MTWNLGDTIAGIPGTVAGTAACPAEVIHTTADAGGRDTYLQSGGSSNRNFGAAAQIKSKTNDKRILLYFPVAALPVGATLTEATLEVTADAANDSRPSDVFELNTAWTEGTSNDPCLNGATWDAPNCTDTWAGGGSFSTADYDDSVASPPVLAGSAVGTTDTTDVTDIVSNWLAGANSGLVIINSTGADVKIRSNDTADPPRLLLSYLTPTPGGCSDVTDLAPEADTYVREDSSVRNYGARNRIETNPANNGAGSNERQGLLRFSMATIPSGATVNSATLTLTSTNSRSNHFVEIRRAIQSWTEGTGSDVTCVTGASWDAPNCTDTGTGWDGSGGNFSTATWGATLYGTAVPDITAQNIDVTALVQGWIDATWANEGVVMLATGTDGGQAQWGTNESGSPANLNVDWELVAEPGRTSTMTAAGTLASDGRTVVVEMELTADTAITNISPSTIQVNGTAAGASCGAATLTSADDDISGAGDSVTFEWSCTVSAGTLPEDITFQATASGDAGATTWPAAVSNSVIVTPVLTFQVTVDLVPPGTSIDNQASIEASMDPVALESDVCYAISNTNSCTGNDSLVSWDRDTGILSFIGEAGSSGLLEASTWNLARTTLYTVDGNDFGTLNISTGAFTSIGSVATAGSPLEGALGNFTSLDVDGISFDPNTGTLYGVHRRGGASETDVLIQIDPSTGLHIEDAFGAGIDYLEIDSDSLSPALYDVDDLTFDFVSGALLAVANAPIGGTGNGDHLILINKSTGIITDIARLTNSAGGGGIDDMEGLSFLQDGTLYGTTGNTPSSVNDDSLWEINVATAVATLVTSMASVPGGCGGSYEDYEAVACRTGDSNPPVVIIPPTPSNIVITNLTASIGDRVWVDLNGDGVQDVGEPGASGITVELFTDPNGNGDPFDDGVSQGTQNTDASGLYLFMNLAPGNYVAVLDLTSLPANYHPSTPTSVADVLAASEQFRNADFGIRPPGAASIGDTVWNDANEDGVVDLTEDLLAGITVDLYLDKGTIGTLDAADILIATQDTDSNGNYLFEGLHDGDHLVIVDETSSVTTPTGGSTTLAAAMDLVSGTNPLAVNLGATEDLTTADFGYNWAGSIGDFVWYDDNGDTVQDIGESGAPNVTVLLYEDTNGNGSKDFGEPVLDSALTDGNGLYLFDNLPPGDYVVDVDESTVPSPTTGNLDSMIATTGDKHAVSLAAAQDSVWMTQDRSVIWSSRTSMAMVSREPENRVCRGSP